MPSEQGHRLYVKGRHLSYQRAKHTTNPNTSLVKIEGVEDSKAAQFYLGKKVAFVYRAKREVRGSNAVQWRMITDARDAGASVYDLRGITEGLDADDPHLGLIQK